MTIFDGIILGIVEGITEFLPISSTAHLILTTKLLGLKNSASLKAYETIIQFGAILAVVLIYKNKIFSLNKKKNNQKLNSTFILWLKLCIAFIPTGLVGLFFYSTIKKFFTVEYSIIFMIITGIIFIVTEKFYKNSQNTNSVSFTKSIVIGFFQTISLIPGISRSGATIIGGMMIGLSRHAAVEFSFLLAIPTMLVATGYEIYKGYDDFLTNYSLLPLIVGFIVSFVVSFVVVKWFLNFIKHYTFTPFGIYLIISGIFFYFAL